MAAKAVTAHGPPRCTVEISPNEVDAGAEFTVRAFVSCPHGCDLRGQGVAIQDRDGAELARSELTGLDGEAHAIGSFALRAPLEAGEHIWRAVVAASTKEDVQHDEASTELSFMATPHAASVNVWGLPSAVAAGERFTFKVGIKCSAGCKLTGRQLCVHDHEGAQAGLGNLLDDVWPGTSALYFAELEAQAPLAIGDHQWRVETGSSESGVPHAAGSCTFTVKVVSQPDHEVTVAAFDSEKQTPIRGVHVLLHPYRALTDESGVARLKVAKGRYRLSVSGFNYVAYEDVVDVAGDVAMRAELTVEPEENEDYRW